MENETTKMCECEEEHQLIETSSFTSSGEWEGSTLECLNCGEVFREI